MRWLTLILLLVIAFLQYRLWIDEHGLREVYQLRHAISAQEQENDALRERNLSLEAEVADLKQGLEAVEERARSELGMVKDGETFYQVIEPEPPQRPGDGGE